MDKEDIKKTIEELKKNSPKRNFNQSYDLIFTYKNLDLKKPEQQVDFYAMLHQGFGKEVKTCALVGPELFDNAKQYCTTVISVDDFSKYASDKKLMKKLAKEHDFFIAQATIMPKVAASFGKVLGPRGKMPNPKAGCVVPPNANLKVLIERLQKTIRVVAKTSLMSQMIVGNQETDEEQLIDNINTMIDQVIHHLNAGRDQVKNVYLKLTMSKPVKLEF